MRPHSASLGHRLIVGLQSIAAVGGAMLAGGCHQVTSGVFAFDRSPCINLKLRNGLVGVNFKVAIEKASAGQVSCLQITSQLGRLSCPPGSCQEIAPQGLRSVVRFQIGEKSPGKWFHVAYEPQEPGQEVIIAQLYKVSGDKPSCSTVGNGELLQSGATTFKVY